MFLARMIQESSKSPERSARGEVQRPSEAQNLHRPRKRAYLACVFCRNRKQRCDGRQPQCRNCMLQGIDCAYKAASKKAAVTPQYVIYMALVLRRAEGPLRIIKGLSAA